MRYLEQQQPSCGHEGAARGQANALMPLGAPMGERIIPCNCPVLAFGFYEESKPLLKLLDGVSVICGQMQT